MVITKTVKVIEGTYAVTSLPCPVCAQTATVEIPSHSLWQYNQGALIHNVMPSESDDVRERFISGSAPPAGQPRSETETMTSEVYPTELLIDQPPPSMFHPTNQP
jgi:hypothetical protein